MYPSPTKTEYVPLASSPDGEADEYNSRSNSPSNQLSNKTISIHPYLLWTCLIVACLSALNITLLPLTLTSWSNNSLSESELAALPYPDQHLGFDRAAKMIPPPAVWHYAWPEQIARMSSSIKNAVYGSGTQVFISVEDTTVMQFPVPTHGTPSCAITFRPPPEFSARKQDLETKGDITEIEVWSIIAPNPAVASSSDKIDFDLLSWNTRPIRGELLGTLDLTSTPNATTVDFACPTESESLIVEFRCLRVACQVKFQQVEMVPKFGFELVRRHE